MLFRSYVDATLNSRRDAVESCFPDTTFAGYKDDELIYEKEYDIAWEVDELREILEKEVYPEIEAGDRIRIFAAVSEDKKVRAELEDEIRENVLKKGAVSEVDVICSYKQGYSWIDEKVNPVLASKGNVDSVEIFFKPFLPEGQTEWLDEDGATPKYNNVKDDPNHWYDLPIRYLQELYPIEDAIVEAVGVEKDQIGRAHV